MAHRMHIGQFRHYPPETANRCYEAARKIPRERDQSYQREQYPMEQQRRWDAVTPVPRYAMDEPPSWADVPISRRPHPSLYQQQPQEPQSWNEDMDSEDVFSTVGHWGPPPKSNGPSQQYHHNPHAFNQPMPMQASDEDVFNNIGEWNSKAVTNRDFAPMPIDLMAPTPLPTFQPYPTRAHSLESPTTSMASTEEKNSWKTLEAILNPKSSRSPSIAESEFNPPVDSFGFNLPADEFGYWTNSNLQRF